MVQKDLIYSVINPTDPGSHNCVENKLGSSCSFRHQIQRTMSQDSPRLKLESVGKIHVCLHQCGLLGVTGIIA